MFIYYVSFFLMAQFILWVIYNNIILPVYMPIIRHEMLKQFFMMAVYAVILYSKTNQSADKYPASLLIAYAACLIPVSASG
jgi:hypothetical protein